MTEKKQPLIINSFSPKGGVGKTTIATQLTVAFRMNDFKVAFYDLDRQKTATHYFSKINEKFRPTEIYDKAGYEHGEVDIVIYDYPPNADFIPQKGTLIVAPTGSGNFDIHSYAKVLALAETNPIIKVLNKVSLVRTSDLQAMAAFDSCVVISQNTAIENAFNEYRTIFNYSHPNSRKAQRQFQFLIDCIIAKKTVKMTPDRLTDISLKGARLNDFQ
jgi:cellulose biosynthesis protein BcsQ